MKAMIDETELARLEKLACASWAGDYSAHDDADANAKYAAAACNAVPALVAEVRKLRRNYECSEKSLQRHEHMVAELMEKVEAGEWLVEVEGLFRHALYRKSYWRWRSCAAYDELAQSLIAAREAVHADRVLGDAEDAFDDLLTAYRREINFVK